MGRLDLRDKWRDEDVEAQADSPVTASKAGDSIDLLAAESHQMDVWECIEIAEKDAA
jgi:hypothetical protein